MKVTWIGQGGLYLQMGGQKIIIDPYLTDSVAAIDPAKARRIAVDESVFDIEPDVLLFTHDHLDHYDPETVERFLVQEHGFTVLAPGTCWQKARVHKGNHNYVLFDEGTEWTQGDVRFTAVKAVHSDPYAIGILIEAEGKTVYVTGDTLYSKKILEQLPDIDLIFLPINGMGNNMNMADAARFVKDSKATLAVPIHVGMMDELDPNDFPCDSKKILEVYKETEIAL